MSGLEFIIDMYLSVLLLTLGMILGVNREYLNEIDDGIWYAFLWALIWPVFWYKVHKRNK